jgi:hypothetical protein
MGSRYVEFVQLLVVDGDTNVSGRTSNSIQ